MTKDFRGTGPMIMRAQLQPTIDLEQGRQRARNEEQVIEPKSEEGNVSVWLNSPTIERIKRATHHAQRIEYVTKPLHSRARIAMPKPVANRTFKAITSITWR